VLAQAPSQDGCGGDGGDDDDGVGTEGKCLPEKIGPAENGDIGARQNRDKINPYPHSDQIADHAADNGAGHPERQPDKHKQPDDAVFTDLILVPFSGFVGSIGESFKPSHDQQLLPDKDKQRIKHQHQNGFEQHTDQDDASVADPHGITKAHTGNAAKDDFGGGHADECLEISRVCEQLDGQP